MRGVKPNDIQIYYAQIESTYLADLISHAKMWPSLARSAQFSATEKFDLDAQRDWLLTWQRRIQDEREKILPETWRQHQKRLPEDFRAICDAPPGTLPIIPRIWSEEMSERLNTLGQLLRS